MNSLQALTVYLAVVVTVKIPVSPKQKVFPVRLHTVLYYGYGHKFYGPKQVVISPTHTVQFFFKASMVTVLVFYGRNMVYG